MSAPYVALVICKALLIPLPPGSVVEHNAQYTGYQPFQWDMTGSVMHCRMHEIPLMPVDDKQTFNSFACMRQGMMEAAQWDTTHEQWKTWKTVCPSPIVDTRSGKIIAWNKPDCGGTPGTVICEVDQSI